MAYEVVIQGNHFKSISDAAKYAEVSVKTMSRRINSGCSDSELLNPIKNGYGHSTKAVAITINGIEFKSYSEAARFYNVPNATFRLWAIAAVNGSGEMYVAETDRVFEPGNPIVIDNVLYISWEQAAYSLGINYQTFVSRVKRGYYEEGYKESDRRSVRPVTANGVLYATRTACAIAHGMLPKTLEYRLKMGISIEDALDEDKYKAAARKIRLQKKKAKDERIKQGLEAPPKRRGRPPKKDESGLEYIRDCLPVEKLKITDDLIWE